jgi:hypothetical protein
MKSAFFFMALFGLSFVKMARSGDLDFDEIYNERYENLI